MNDAEMIADRLADEIEGGQKYRELAEQATDTKVKALFLDIASEEDSHAAWLRKLQPASLNGDGSSVWEQTKRAWQEAKRLKLTSMSKAEKISYIHHIFSAVDLNNIRDMVMDPDKYGKEAMFNESISTSESRSNKGEELFGRRNVVNETNTDEMKRLKSELKRAIIDRDKNKAEYLKLEIRKLQGEIELRKERSNSIPTAESRRNKGEALFGTRKNGNIFCPATTYSSKETVRDTYPGSYAIISVDGGWLVFMTASDYTTWQGQR